MPLLMRKNDGNNDGGLIVQMRCTARMPSGTFLWSALLLNGKETPVTECESGRGGYVPHGLPMGRDVVRAHVLQVPR